MRRVLLVGALLLALMAPGWGQDQPEWRVLMGQAMSLHREGQDKAAIAIAEKALEMARADGDPLAEATVSSSFAVIYLESEDYHRAYQLFASAAQVYEEDPRLGPEHEYTAKLYKSLALCAHQLGRDKEAEQLFRKALHVYEMLDERHSHPDTLDIVQGLAGSLAAQGRIREARPLYQEVVEKSEPESLAVMKALQGLAQLDSKVGDYEAAIAGLQRVTAYYSRSADLKSLDRWAVALGDLGAVYQEKGDYRAAERHFQKALRLRRSTSAGRPSVGTSINNLASLLSEIGDKEQALSLYREALEIHSSRLGQEHPYTVASLNNLALVLADLGQPEEAEKLLRQALTIERKLEGESSAGVAGRLNNLAGLHLEARQYARALPPLQEAAEIGKASAGQSQGLPPLEYATVLSNLGSALAGLGHYEEAEKAFRAALDLGGRSTAYTAHNNLAYLYIDTAQPEQALREARLAGDAHFQRLREVFSFTSERQRLAFMKEKSPYGLYASLGSAADLFRTALRFKGAVLDSMVEDRRLARAGQNPELARLLREMADDKAELLRLELLPAGDPGRESLPIVRARLEEGEAKLAGAVTDLPRGRDLFEVTPAQVQAALPPDTVLVEFLYHGFYLGRGRDEKRYSALLVSHQRPPTWVPLGSASEMESLIKAYREQIQGRRSATRAGRVLAGSAAENRSPSALRALHDKLWSPIAAALPDHTRSIVLSPDGELNFVSFATLLGPDDKFLGETMELSYVSSGRDLVLPAASSPALEVALIGAPEFGAPAESAESEAAPRIVLSALPGTREECLLLESVLARAGGEPELYLGEQATEPKVAALKPPKILHLATHGLFLSSEHGPENPMSRSGLALVGAQITLDAWSEGSAPDPAGDGFLSAEEVGVMDLSPTELVVLSACDTGLGAAQNGEGVLGLRRGFVQSGAANLLFTLWPIDDSETARFMQDFYHSFRANGSPRASLSLTQREWLARLKSSAGPLGAARLAGPFVLSTRGRLPSAANL